MTDHDRASTNWKRATMLVWEADDAELTLVIQIVTDFATQHRRVITAAELRAILQHPGW